MHNSMSDLYTSLQVSPRKKRCPPELDDGNTLTPKKLRTAPPTPPPSTSRLGTNLPRQTLPSPLARLYNIQTALQYALSHALATCAISPTADSGHVKNVLNHISLTTYAGFITTSFEVDDLKRLCWFWEWDGKPLGVNKPQKKVENEDNPFLVDSKTDTPPTEWVRGSMGVILSPSTHFSKANRKRVPAYGIGIEVEMDIDKDMGSGMAAVARWTANAENRRAEFLKKLEQWVELQNDTSSLVDIPLADLPELSVPKISALTRTLASCSPSSASSIKLPVAPSSPTRSPVKKVTRDFAVPFSTTLIGKSPSKKSTVLFPQTPSRRDRDIFPGSGSVPPQTPSSVASSPSKDSLPSTPVHQRGSNDTPLQTPSTSRRQALYERVRQRSLSMSPTKPPRDTNGKTPTRDQMLKMTQDELRRRCLLGRLSGIAESIWMLFSNPTPGNSSTPARKRRALPSRDVVTAIVKSSPVPISTSEANESIGMLIKLCPFFLKKLGISGDDWLEMPAPTAAAASTGTMSSPSKGEQVVPSSPGRLKGKEESAQELINRSPRRVKRETGGLREVREIIRRELELQD